MTAQANPNQPKAFLGQSPAIQHLRERLDVAVRSGLEVLLIGETGTGKSLAAALLHQKGPRRDRPLIPLSRGNLAGFLEEAGRHIHDQLPGDGPKSQPRAWIRQAQGSTLLLEDVGEWSKQEQSGIMSLLRYRTKEKVGGYQPLDLDVQLIATTQTDLNQAVNEGRFWPDLYYRLRGVPIELPPLRDHREDLPLLAEHFLAQSAQQYQQTPRRLSPVALELLLSHQWPGNVRELKHCLKRATVLATEGQIESRHLWANRS